MNRILFVDDDPDVLQGFADVLRADRKRWQVVCVGSAGAALQELAKAPFDLVISDMRMPQMDGAALLTEVKNRYPATARIVLSGHADQSAILRTLPVAQQYLSKPCEPARLREVIERTCSLNALLAGGPARLVIGSLDRLPSVPATYLALTEAMARPDVNIAKVVSIVEQDPAMCVKILQLVNSAYFGLSNKLTSLRHAVTYLGLELLKALVLSAHIFSTVDPDVQARLRLDQVQQHCLFTARMMRRFLEGEKKLAEDAFTTALVHEVGAIVLALSLGDEYVRIRARARDEGRPCHAVETDTLGVSHAEIGAYLLGLWGLPFHIVEAVAYHHRPSGLPRRDDCRLLAALHVANVLAVLPGDKAELPADTLDQAFIDSADCHADIERWRAIAAEEFNGAAP
ncbi:MAG: response regulator [Nevskia sp.]|nr:response regulator [Nevskia sp.]